jgi:hypothetical protein
MGQGMLLIKAITLARVDISGHTKKARPQGPAFILANNKMLLAAGQTTFAALDRNNVFCLQTLGALCDRELDALAFSQGFESGAGNCTEMSEHIRTGLLLDKAETLGVVEPFYGSIDCIRHNNILVFN